MKKIFSILIFALIVGGVIYCWPTKDKYSAYHYATYTDKFMYGLENAKPAKVYDEKVYGGIMSHHLYVANELASFFGALKKQQPKTVVLIGPNHYSLGKSDILVSKYPYKTPWGVLEPNLEIIDQISVAQNDEGPFEMEHSISADVAYIKATFPEAKIVPIILKRNTTKDRLDQLVGSLNKVLPSDSLVLASVDFSHHNQAIVSEFHDKKSISAIENFDYEKIFKLEIDSPPSIYTILKYLEGKGAQKVEYKNTNSAIFGANPNSEDVTSYLFAFFTKGKPKNDENITILNFGDMMFDRGVRSQMKKGYNPFEFIRGTEGNFLRGVDFIVGNLEGPITETPRAKCQQKELNFQFASTTGEMLKLAGITMVNLSNNHSFDCYQMGVSDTRKYLTDGGVGFFGGGLLEDSYTIKEVQNKKIAFVGVDQTILPISIEKFNTLIKKLKSENDYVVVNVHWGFEYKTVESKIQDDIAHGFIDNGADVIFGHHPHVMQPVEIYKGKVIFYSLGNLIFDQHDFETNRGFGAGVVLEGGKMGVLVFPYNIIKTQPKFVTPKEAVLFCDEWLKNIEDRKGCSFEVKK